MASWISSECLAKAPVESISDKRMRINGVYSASVFYPTIPYPTILLDRSQNNISEQHWFYPISNHFAASTAKLSNRFIWSRRVKISYRCCFIQPVFRDIQPFGTIQTHIQPLLVYPTIFPNYPTVWIESKPYPTISGLSNHYPTVWIDSNPYPTVSGLSNRFCRYPTIFGFIQPFPVIRFIPNLSNRFSGDIQPFGSNQIQIPPFLSLSNRFVDIQPFRDLSNHFLRSDSFLIYPTTVGYPKNGWIWISRKPSLVEQNGQKKSHPQYPFGVLLGWPIGSGPPLSNGLKIGNFQNFIQPFSDLSNHFL